MERRQMQQAELLGIDAALSEWVGNLPETIRLYDEDGRREAYYRPISELFIQYFIAIVMSQMLRHNERDRPWRTSIPSRIAASCAATLYDEIDCREETVFLLPNHGFFCLATSLPLICYYPPSEPERVVRNREIATIRSILNGMRDRYGDSDMILAKMDKLQNTVERSSPSEDLDSMPSEGQASYAYAKELFPFPSVICDKIDQLEFLAATDQPPVMNDSSLLQTERAGDSFFGYSFMDLFELDLTAFNYTDEDSHDPFYA